MHGYSDVQGTLSLKNNGHTGESCDLLNVPYLGIIFFSLSFPSCRVACSTADLPSPHRPVRLLARAQCRLFKYRWHASFHLVFGRPFFIFHGISVLSTSLSMCSSSILITCTYPFNRPYVIFLEACETLVVPRLCAFLIWSLRVTPHIGAYIVTFSSRSHHSLFRCHQVYKIDKWQDYQQP